MTDMSALLGAEGLKLPCTPWLVTRAKDKTPGFHEEERESDRE